MPEQLDVAVGGVLLQQGAEGEVAEERPGEGRGQTGQERGIDGGEVRLDRREVRLGRREVRLDRTGRRYLSMEESSRNRGHSKM